MTCPALPPEDLVAFLDGELPPADAGRAAAHVAACAACSREAAQLRRSAELLRLLPGLPPSPGFAERVTGAVLASSRSSDDGAPGTGPASSAESPSGRPAGRLLRLPRWVAAAAALVVAAVAGTWIAAGSGRGDRLSPREEEEIARDLLVLAHLETLSAADADDLATIADDLDVIEAVADSDAGSGG